MHRSRFYSSLTPPICSAVDLVNHVPRYSSGKKATYDNAHYRIVPSEATSPPGGATADPEAAGMKTGSNGKPLLFPPFSLFQDATSWFHVTIILIALLDARI